MDGITINLDPGAFEPVIERVVRRVMREARADRDNSRDQEPQGRLMTKEQGAQYLCVASVRTLERIAEDHGIRFFRDKGVVRVDRHDLDALIQRVKAADSGQIEDTPCMDTAP